MVLWIREWAVALKTQVQNPLKSEYFLFYFLNVQGVQNGRVGFFKLNYGRTMMYFNILKCFSEFLTMLHFFF